MKKLGVLRQAVLDSPLKIDAKQLLTFAEKGTVRSWRGDPAAGDVAANKGFLIEYTAHLIVTDYTGAPQDLFFVALGWLHDACPDAAEDAIRFHVDIIDGKKADVSLAVDINEIVATPDGGGGKVKLQPSPDPDARGFDMTAFFRDMR